MLLSEKNLTIIITTFKSEKIVDDCILSVDEKYPIIVVENSDNISFKKNIEDKFKNVRCHLLGKNLGYTQANNTGIKLANTNFVYIINPDVRLEKDTIENLSFELENLKDFSIASPLETTSLENRNFGFFKKKQRDWRMDVNFKYDRLKKNHPAFNKKELNLTPLEVDYVDGFSMLINKSKFRDNHFFDENIFIYLENNDLCKRALEKGEKIFLIPKSKIKHLGGKSHQNEFIEEMELSRNWHWMWSTFYFNKKHYGYFSALSKTYIIFLKAIVKFLFYSILFNKKKKIYQMRFSGLLNSMLGKSSWYRPKIK